MGSTVNAVHREPWNKGKIVGQKAPFKLKDIWALRVRLQMENRIRELALFNLGIDSKLRGCDLVALKVRDICHGDQIASRAVVMQHKTQRPVQFEITPAARDAVQKWVKLAGLKSDDFLFPSRIHASPHLGTRQYARILEGWVEELGLDPAEYGTHSMRRTKATLIYRRKEPARCPVAAWTFQARVDSEIPRHRGRRRLGDLGTDRNLNGGICSPMARPDDGSGRTFPPGMTRCRFGSSEAAEHTYRERSRHRLHPCRPWLG